MGYADCFALLDVVLLTAVVSVVLTRKASASGGAAHWKQGVASHRRSPVSAED
jgi:hypothetical protein